MLQEPKVRLMARAALYEQSLGSRAIKLNRYYRKGAFKAALFHHVPAGIITFFLAAVLAAAFIPEKVKDVYDLLGITYFLILAAAICVVFAFCYALYSRHMFRKQYEDSKGVFWKYNFIRDKLRRMEETGRKDGNADAGGRSR